MAEVFLAVADGPVGFAKLVVVKAMRAGLSHESGMHVMFHDEARLASRLNHPNVVQTHEVGHEQGRLFLAMEYLEGQPLNALRARARQAGAPLPLRFELRVVLDALAGLHYAHELCDYDGAPLGVVHRDVSPHNIFVTYDGQTKLLDFGIAKDARAQHTTETGDFKGKVAYMAPEQAIGPRIDRSADVFSMGIVLWEAAARRRFWGTLRDMQLLQQLCSKQLPPLREVPSDVPEGLLRICERALAPEPGDRYASAIEMRAELEAFVDAHGMRAEPTELGALVTDLFRTDRSTVRRTIEAQLARNVTSTTDQFASVNRIDTGEESPLGTTPSSTNAISSASPPRPSWSKVIASFGVATALGTAVYFMASKPRALPSRPMAPLVVAHAADAPSAPPMPASSVDAPELRVTLSPPSAKLYIDGRRLESSSFAATFPRGTAHEVRAEADGYRALKRELTLDRSTVLELTLERAHATTAGARTRASARAADPPQPPNDARPAPDLPSPQPTSKNRPVRPIDTSAPF